MYFDKIKLRKRNRHNPTIYLQSKKYRNKFIVIFLGTLLCSFLLIRGCLNRIWIRHHYSFHLMTASGKTHPDQIFAHSAYSGLFYTYCDASTDRLKTYHMENDTISCDPVYLYHACKKSCRCCGALMVCLATVAEICHIFKKL